MDCPTCGRPAQPGAAYCHHCGARLPSGSGGGEGGQGREAQPARAGVLPSNVHAPLGPEGDLAPAASLVYAGFWRRFTAWLIDAVVVFVLEIAAGLLLAAVVAVTSAGDAAASAASLLLYLLSLLYFPVLESSSAQATLGKRALNIVVTDTRGRRLSFWRALARTLGKVVSGLLLGIGYLMVAFTDRKQGLHDLLAGCLVVVGPPAAAGARQARAG